MTLLNTTIPDMAEVYIGNNGTGLTIQIIEYSDTVKDYVAVDLTNMDNIIMVTFANKANVTIKTTLQFQKSNAVNGIITAIVGANDFATVGAGDYFIQATVTSTSPIQSISTIYEKTVPNVLLVRNKL